MPNEKGIITGHFVAHWGVPKEIRPQKARGIHEFAVLEFAPRGKRDTWRYATNGMSSYVQAHPDEDVRVRTEIYAGTRDRAIWVDALFAAIAAYPQDYNTYLAEGDTIDVGQAIDQAQSCYAGVLCAAPGPIDPPTIGLVGGLAQNVLVHQVVGLLPVEIQYAARHGGKVLWEHLVNMGKTLLDVKRKPVV